jgi:isorenieratene synthase
LKLAFNTFARAFFAEEDRLSFAELVKSFHFYYLGQDGGLVYDFPNADYEAALLGPIRAELAKNGAEVRLGEAAPAVRAHPEKPHAFALGEEVFEHVIVATDVVGARSIAQSSEGLPPSLVGQLSQLVPGQRYSVWRLWIDKDVREDIPVFVITERRQVLDAVTLYHRFEKESMAQLAEFGTTAVLELHCYAVPDALTEAEVKAAFLSELLAHFPELRGMRVLFEHFQMRQDFTAFHVGMYENRPTVTTNMPGLHCAGDWVKLPFPAMLLEAAAASGLLAANEVLREEGLREELVTSVPLRGLMAGMPAPPARRVLD